MSIDERSFERGVTWAFVTGRSLLFCLLFLALRLQPRGDIPAYLCVGGVGAVLAHLLPYRDFTQAMLRCTLI